MSDLREIYQELIVDHGRNPRNFRKITNARFVAEGHNPLCGDRLVHFVQTDEHDVVTDVAFDGQGCAISTASASLMTEALKGKSLAQVEALFRAFHNMITDAVATDDVDLGKLHVLAGVKAYPTRVKCATLAWHTLHSALRKGNHSVSTE